VHDLVASVQQPFAAQSNERLCYAVFRDPGLLFDCADGGASAALLLSPQGRKGQSRQSSVVQKTPSPDAVVHNQSDDQQ
jgi:hypothetical protein